MNINIMEKNTLIDFHAHILPGMDHGCDDIVMSVRQLRMAGEHKVDIVIATSHYYPDQENVEHFLRRRAAARDSIEAVRRDTYPAIRLGAEVLICSNIDKMMGIEALCIENSRVLLIEMPFIKQWDMKLIATVERLRNEKELEVVLAHGERYPMKELDKLLERGFPIQVNVSPALQLKSLHFVKQCIEYDYVAAFGSDIHGLHNSYRDFTRSIRRLGSPAEKVMERTRMLLGE